MSLTNIGPAKSHDTRTTHSQIHHGHTFARTAQRQPPALHVALHCSVLSPLRVAAANHNACPLVISPLIQKILWGEDFLLDPSFLLSLSHTSSSLPFTLHSSLLPFPLPFLTHIRTPWPPQSTTQTTTHTSPALETTSRPRPCPTLFPRVRSEKTSKGAMSRAKWYGPSE